MASFNGITSPSMTSSTYLSALIVAPLRYFFANYGSEQSLLWSKDTIQSQIEIDTMNNFHKVQIGQKPRVLVDRGQFGVSPTGLTDNMAERTPIGTTLGLTNIVNFVMYRGQANIVVQARQEGTCERVAELVYHYLVWSAPYFCDTQGFKSFAKNLVVSPCTPSTEDVEIFEVQMGVPWVKEEMWSVTNDSVTIKGIDLYLSS